METNTDKRKTLIRRLLVEQLLPEEKQNLLKRNSVENEMKKQWKQFEDDPIKSEVKKRIWRNVQRRCEGKSDTLVHIELWHSLAAAVVILLVIGGLLFLSGNDDMGVEKTIRNIKFNLTFKQSYLATVCVLLLYQKTSSLHLNKCIIYIYLKRISLMFAYFK